MNYDDVPADIRSRFLAPPRREGFDDEESFEEAMGYWQSHVGRNLGMAMLSLRCATGSATSSDTIGDKDS